jgi:hypothetical protein
LSFLRLAPGRLSSVQPLLLQVHVMFSALVFLSEFLISLPLHFLPQISDMYFSVRSLYMICSVGEKRLQ